MAGKKSLPWLVLVLEHFELPQVSVSVLGLDLLSLPNAGPSKAAGGKSSEHLPSNLYTSTLLTAIAFLKTQLGPCLEL